jgi:hypothetical protein
MSDQLSLLLARISTEDQDSALQAGGGFSTSPSTRVGSANNDGEFLLVGGTSGTDIHTSLRRAGMYSSVSLLSDTGRASEGAGGLLGEKLQRMIRMSRKDYYKQQVIPSVLVLVLELPLVY